MLTRHLDRQTDGQSDSYIPPPQKIIKMRINENMIYTYSMYELTYSRVLSLFKQFPFLKPILHFNLRFTINSDPPLRVIHH